MKNLVDFAINNWEIVSGVAVLIIDYAIGRSKNNDFKNIGHFIEEKIKAFKPKK